MRQSLTASSKQISKLESANSNLRAKLAALPNAPAASNHEGYNIWVVGESEEGSKSEQSTYELLRQTVTQMVRDEHSEQSCAATD